MPPKLILKEAKVVLEKAVLLKRRNGRTKGGTQWLSEQKRIFAPNAEMQLEQEKASAQIVEIKHPTGGVGLGRLITGNG
jgi:hypothetical protein